MRSTILISKFSAMCRQDPILVSEITCLLTPETSSNLREHLEKFCLGQLLGPILGSLLGPILSNILSHSFISCRFKVGEWNIIARPIHECYSGSSVLWNENWNYHYCVNPWVKHCFCVAPLGQYFPGTQQTFWHSCLSIQPFSETPRVVSCMISSFQVAWIQAHLWITSGFRALTNTTDADVSPFFDEHWWLVFTLAGHSTCLGFGVSLQPHSSTFQI